MRHIPDIIIKNKNSELIAIVEVKNRKNLTRKIAVEYRRNIIAHGLPEKYHYFLIISEDMGFLWINKETQDLDSPPDKEFPMKSIINKLSITREKNGRYRNSELEMIIYQWLFSLMYGQNNYNNKTEKSLYAVGFIKDIQNADIELESVL